MLGHGRVRVIISSVILALVLCLSFALSFYIPSYVADALLPAGYVEDVIDEDLEWWTAEDCLNLSLLKSTVNSWKENLAYDFEYLKANPIIIAVIDSGANIEHELFSGKYDENGNHNIGAVDKNGVGIYDVLLRDKNGKPILKNTAVSHNKDYKEDDITDDENRKHGTHVAGIVATLIHALDLEQYIKILPIKASYHTKPLIGAATDSFSGTDVKNAIEFAIEQGADVINMSLSSDKSTFAGIDKSDYHKKAVLVAAAGNNNYQSKYYPAALPNVIGVMNYTHSASGDIVLSNSSNYGEWSDGSGYDVSAPGTAIYSADGSGDLNYKSLSGTSMASPVVSFGVALLAMKFKALAGENGKPINYTELADLVRVAYTDLLTCNESGVKIGPYKIFDINELVGYSMYSARIAVDDLSLLNQRLGDIKTVALKIGVAPASEYGNGTVEWFIDGEKIGSGFELRYTPKSEVGDTTITAVWKHDKADYNGDTEHSASVKISVDYMRITSDTVSKFEFAVSENGVPIENLTSCKVGQEYHFDVSALQNISEIDAQSCLWFVNGELKHTGYDFDFVPEEDGEYKISIKLKGIESKETVLEVKTDTNDKERMRVMNIVTGVLSSVIAVTVIIVVGVVIGRRLTMIRNK